MSDQNEELKKAGFKVTQQRRKILEILERAEPHHMSAEDVYKALQDAGSDIGLATVYRVLTQFEAARMVRRHQFADGYAVFEIDSGEHHDHMVCVRCDRVEEFIDEVIERHQQQIAKKAGFKMTDHKLTIYGICKQCVDKS